MFIVFFTVVSLQLLAEAMKLQAEATIKIADAIDRMARTEERQTSLLELIHKQLNTKNTN